MLNKIDKNLLLKTRILDKTCLLDVIVYVDDFSKAKSILNKVSESDLIELPIISAFALRTRFNNIYKIVKSDIIKFVTGETRVCSLIYKSKKILNVDFLLKFVNEKIVHTCVVIDTGIYPHIDFCLGQNRIIEFIDLINQIDEPYDDNGHGTFVSGVLCGRSIVSKYNGIDANCNIIVIKALDKDGETSSIKILQAMQWILQNKKKFNIKVVCMSFGSQLFEHNDPLMMGAEVLWDNGIVVISAGGNSGPDNSTIMSPGASKKIITVGSLSNDDEFKVADFSSRGPAFNYFKPDLVVPGEDIIATNVFNKNKKFYVRMSGTSVSAPMVAGVASLLFKVNPNYTPNQIKYMIVNSCVKINGDRNSEGFGRLDLSNLKLL